MYCADRIPASTTSAEAHAAQRALAKERKAAKPNADNIARSKKIWERLRRKSHVPVEERNALVTELFEILTGRVRDFVFKHDSVRVVQCALKYANQQQRKHIVMELRGDLRALAESKYGKFLVAKMVVEGYVSISLFLSFPRPPLPLPSPTPRPPLLLPNSTNHCFRDSDIRGIIVPEFYGHVRRLINHPEAAWILDDIYRQVATASQRALLLREWYGAEFAVFGKTKAASLAPSESPAADLATLLKESPEKKKTIMQYLQQIINQLVQKKMTGFTMLHDAMLQYFINTTPTSPEANEFLELLKSDLDEEGGGDLLKNLAFTKSGSRVVSLALAYGTAKDRKTILRVYKDTIEMMAFDQHAHMVLVAAMDLIDDTKMTAKMIFPELLGENIKDQEERMERLLNLAAHPTARIPLLYPLAEQAKWLIPEPEKTVLPELHAIRETTSKKNADTRLAELVQYMSPYLLALVEHRAQELAASIFGCHYITEVLLDCPGDKAAASQAVAEIASGDPLSEEHISQSPAAGKMLRALVSGGKFDPATKSIKLSEPRLGFGNVLFEVIKNNILDWAISPSNFVIVALVESEDVDAAKKEVVLAQLKKGKKTLQKAASGELQPPKTTKSDSAAAAAKDDESKGKNKKSKKASKVPMGNPGAKILLQKL